MKKISIIIPAYNCAKYIRKCINSILAQSGAELEIIVIDDGSSDNTVDILKEYGEKISVESISNSGVPTARNTGLAKATGELVMFIDSDDYLEDGAIEKLVKKQEETNADIVKFRYKCVYTDGTSNVPEYQIDTEFFSEKSEFKEKVYPMFIEGIRLNSVCMSMFKRTILKDIWFKVGMATAEDAMFSLNAVTKASNILFIPDVLYAYYQSNEGLTGRGVSVWEKYKNNYALAFETISLLKQWDMDSFIMRIRVLMRPVFLTFDKLNRLKKVSKAQRK